RGDRNTRDHLFVLFVASMRPRLQDRGDTAISSTVERQSIASMRPRLQDRGDSRPCDNRSRMGNTLQCGHGSKTVEMHCASVESKNGGVASMRPRLQDRGDYRRPPGRRTGYPSFNAATAPRPWRYSGAVFHPAGAGGFNAATAPRPWRCGFCRVSRCWKKCFNAATAPRPWRSADRAETSPADRGFNAATAPRPWRSPAGTWSGLKLSRLQCGHGSKTVEMGVADCGTKANGRASMRPRLQDRGDHFFGSSRWLGRLQLQCGHGSKTVEIRPSSLPIVSSPSRAGLQCGHGSKTVEIPCCTCPRSGEQVASMRPRLQDRGDRYQLIRRRKADPELQCGHGSKTVEIESWDSEPC